MVMRPNDWLWVVAITSPLWGVLIMNTVFWIWERLALPYPPIVLKRSMPALTTLTQEAVMATVIVREAALRPAVSRERGQLTHVA